MDEAGYRLWLDYKKTVIQNYGLPSTTVKMEISITKKLITVLKSDAAIYWTAHMQSQCFSTTQNSQIYLAWDNTETSIDMNQNFLSAHQKYVHSPEDWNNIYREYIDFYQAVSIYK